MYINKDDLNLLIEVENYMGNTIKDKDDPKYDYVLRLMALNEKLIQQRLRDNEKIRKVVAERRKIDKDYARSKKG